eukprot:3020640-Amphidinium_carterae.1
MPLLSGVSFGAAVKLDDLKLLFCLAVLLCTEQTGDGTCASGKLQHHDTTYRAQNWLSLVGMRERATDSITAPFALCKLYLLIQLASIEFTLL